MPDTIETQFETATRWREEALALRAILLDCGLSEAQKWGKPCYSHDGANICIIQRFSDFLALLFFKGALIRDVDGILAPQGPNSRSGYRAVFTSAGDVEAAADSLRACVAGAIEMEKKGLKVEAPDPDDLDMPDELIDAFDADPDLRTAFDELTPGRQRGYLLHFSGAKQSATRHNRIGKARDRIMAGKGFNER